MKRVSFHTLGCKLNFSETATVSRQFKQNGFEVVEFDNVADVYVINTCSVTEQADIKCRKLVRQVLRNNPEAYVLVMGCYAQLKPEEIAQIPGVDAVLGAAEKFRLFEIIQDFSKQPITQVHRCSIEATLDFRPSYSTEERTRAFLKIQDGCDYKCSFCTIPLARGKSRSDSLHNILENAKQLAQERIRELVLTGVNIGDYSHEANDFLKVVQALDKNIQNIPRFRISSIEPNLLSNEIIEYVANSRAFMPHFHIPLQSGSNPVLAAMRRRYKRELYADRVLFIKKLMPDACIGCDVIVGFPTETAADFQETLAFLTDLPVSYLHVFPYSARNHTLAAELPNVVSPTEKNHRAETLRALSLKKMNDFANAYIRTTRTVLFERATDGDFLEGFTDNYIKVRAPFAPHLPNEIMPTTLIDWDGKRMQGNALITKAIQVNS